MSAATDAMIIVAIACSTAGALFGLMVSLLAGKRYGVSKAEARILGETLLSRHTDEIGVERMSVHWRLSRTDPKRARHLRCDQCQRIRELLKEGLDNENNNQSN